MKQAETQAWLARAREDLRHAQHDLAEEEFLPDVCWHAQQAAEKVLKAYLIAQAIPFRFVHDIDYLLDQVRTANPRLAQALRDVAKLTPYAVQTRYPANEPAITFEDARQAVRLAEKTRDAVLCALQPDCEDLSL